MIKKQCAVLFPIYRAPSRIEQAFIENGVNKTLNFDHIIVAPENLTNNIFVESLKHLKVERFADIYFENIEGYNRLLLLIDFYERFKNYTYILIHQADVYLFKDELNYWCELNYDYIGAPWLKSNKLNKGFLYDQFYRNFYQPLLEKKRKNGWLYNKVGNGGLSLRKVEKAISILNICPQTILNKYQNTKSPHYNEDVFWSIEARKIDKKFKIPNWKVALNFSIEFEPEFALTKLNGKLPFGCHAPSQINDKFWQRYIPVLQSVEN